MNLQKRKRKLQKLREIKIEEGEEERLS